MQTKSRLLEIVRELAPNCEITETRHGLAIANPPDILWQDIRVRLTEWQDNFVIATEGADEPEVYRRCEVPGTWALYRVDLGFGGSEEGGWWFDVGDLVASLPGVRVHWQDASEGGWRWHANVPPPEVRRWALAQAEQFDLSLDRHARSNSYRSSSTDDGQVQWYPGEDGPPPEHYPERRPRYE